MPIKPSHHHIEETDAGLDRPLYPINKLYDKTLKSQNYCANIQPFTHPFPLELLGRVAVYAVPVSRYRPSSRLASEPRTCLQATHLAHDNSAVVCRLRHILIVRLFSTVTKRGRAKIGPILLTLLARYAAGSMKRHGVRPSVCLSVPSAWATAPNATAANFADVGPAVGRYRSTAAGAQHQCGQRHVEIRSARIHTDLFVCTMIASCSTHPLA